MKVLLAGYGSIGKKHVAALRQIEPGAEIYALRSGKNAAASDDDIHDIYGLEDAPSDIDFILVSNPTSEHTLTIRDTLYLGKPYFIEKPLTHQEFPAEILDVIRQKNIPAYVACNLRFLDVLVWTRQFISDQKIHEVNIYGGSYLPDWRPGADYREVYSSQHKMGGGVHLDLIHEIDYCCWIFGLPLTYSSFRSSLSSLGIDAADYANYLLHYPGFAASIILNYYRRDAKRTLEIITDSATILVDLARNRAENLLTGQVVFESPQKISDTYFLQMKYFTDMLRDHHKPMINDIFEACEILKICLNDSSAR